jgi:hypothetical protein
MTDEYREKLERAATKRFKAVKHLMDRFDFSTVSYITAQIGLGTREEADERLLRTRRDEIFSYYERKAKRNDSARSAS